MQLTREEYRALLSQSMRQLTAHPPFQAFMALVKDCHDSTAADLCNDMVVGSDRLTLTTIGELRCYRSLLDTYDEHRANTADHAQSESG